VNPARRRLPLIALAASALVLAGCAATATPEPVASASPKPSATPATEPTPVDPLTTVAEIVVRPEHLDLHDASGEIVTTLSYDAEAMEFVDTLTTVLGASPETSEQAASMETPPVTEYQWDGLLVADDHEADVLAEGSGPIGPFDMNLAVHVMAPTLGDGVTVRTVNGFRPGGDAQVLAAELGEPWTGNGYDQVRVETGDPIGERHPGFTYENAYSVAVNTWEWRGASNTIFAPWNFGIGHV
jgi:hypothetical protein